MNIYPPKFMCCKANPYSYIDDIWRWDFGKRFGLEEVIKVGLHDDSRSFIRDT